MTPLPMWVLHGGMPNRATSEDVYHYDGELRNAFRRLEVTKIDACSKELGLRFLDHLAAQGVGKGRRVLPTRSGLNPSAILDREGQLNRMRRTGVTNEVAMGTLMAATLIGVTGVIVVTTYQDKTVTQTETTTARLTTTATTTQPTTITRSTTQTQTITITTTTATISCGSEITTDATLSQNIGPCSGNGLVIGADGIVLDRAGYTISSTGTGTNIGILINGKARVIVRNCQVSGFAHGFYFSDSSNNTLTGNTANNNTRDGFRLYGSSGNTLSGNTADNNTQYGYYDGSTGSGTAGTADFYSGNECSGNGAGGSSPSGLGSPQSWNRCPTPMNLCPDSEASKVPSGHEDPRVLPLPGD